MVIALGVSWLLDGLEVTVVGSIGPALQRPETLGLSASQIGWAASAYIGGAVLGALYFGRLADKLGRKRMFLVTLVVYLVATVMTAFTWDIYSFAFCRFLTGFGIGGEYAAINSAIDELIPARLRGRVDLAVNGTFWVGAAMGAGYLFSTQVDWLLAWMSRNAALAATLIGALLAVYVMYKAWQRWRLARVVAASRITVDELAAMLDGGAPPHLIDIGSKLAHGHRLHRRWCAGSRRRLALGRPLANRIGQRWLRSVGLKLGRPELEHAVQTRRGHRGVIRREDNLRYQLVVSRGASQHPSVRQIPHR